MAYDVKTTYTLQGLDFPKEKQLEILAELLDAVKGDKAVLTGALFDNKKITVWVEVK